MKRICLIALILWSCIGYSQNTFLEIFNFQDGGQALFMKPTEDGGYFLTGNNIADLSTFYTKTDSFGNIEFSKIIAASELCKISDMITINGRNILIGQDDSGIFFFIKIDQAGNFQSMRSFFSSQVADLGFVDKTDSTILWTGNISSTSNYSISIAKTDTGGTFLWGKKLTNVYYMGTYSVVSIGSDGFYLVGSAYDNSFLNIQTSVVKCDTSGNVIWAKLFDLESQGRLSADKASNNSLIISSAIRDSIGIKTILLKIDSFGNMEWNKVYSAPLSNGFESSVVKCVFETGYVITGNVLNTPEQHPFLFKTDLAGNIIWSNQYIGTYEYSHGLCLTTDSGFAIAGSTNGFSAPSYTTGFLAKTDSNGIFGCFDLPLTIDTSSILISSTNLTFTTSFYSLSDTTRAFPQTTDDTGVIVCSPTLQTNNVELFSSTFYPNPVCNSAVLRVKFFDNKKFQLTISNVLGEIIFNKNILEEETQLNFSNYKNGVYFYNLSAEEKKLNGNFIINH